MKKIILICVLGFLSSNAYASKYCDGFKSGYITGYKQASGRSTKPMVPMCPMKPMKKMKDLKDDHEFGYLHGLEKGKEKGSR
jgi:hypothetical protein